MSLDPADQSALRAAFSAFMTGVTVVTTIDEAGQPKGFTANSFTSVSLDPPLLLFCIAKTSRSLEAFRKAETFAVNILSEHQRDLSSRFAKPVDNRFEGVEWRAGAAGAPILDHVCGWFDCRVYREVEAGDHWIILGEVVGFDYDAKEALGYSRSGYFTLEDAKFR